MTDHCLSSWELESSYPLDCRASGKVSICWIKYQPLDPADTHFEGQHDTV